MRPLLFMVLLLNSSVLLAQNSLVGQRFSTGNGLCSRILKFPNDSICLSNWGCEGPGTTTVSRYKIVNDTVVIFGFENNLIEILRIDSSQDKSRLDRVVIKVYDQAKQNISSKMNFTAKRSNGTSYSFRYDKDSDFLHLRANPTEEKIFFTTLSKANKGKLEWRYFTNNVFEIHVNVDPYFNKTDYQWNAINFSDSKEKLLITPLGLRSLQPQKEIIFGEPSMFYEKY